MSFFGPADPPPTKPKPTVEVVYDWDEDCWIIEVTTVNKKGEEELFKFRVDN